MSYRPRLVLVLSLLILLSLVLSACNRERPATTTTTTPTSGRGTVAAPTAAAVGTQVAAPTATGEASAMPTPSAPTPQQVVVSPAAPATGGNAQTFTYTVVAGDTLATIASRFGTTQDAIAQLNSLADPNALMPGQKLQIPGTGAATTGAGTGGATGGSATTGGATTGGATTGGTSTYTVQSGDTLGRIAQRFGTTVAELQRLNPSLTDPNILSLGQTLVVPGGAGSATGGATAGTTTGQSKTYVVQRGDTLLSIARRFGLTLKDLQAANNITNPDKIYPGQKLVIP